MSDKMSEVYDAYDVEVIQTMRGRGATILRTDKGIRQVKALDVNESRLFAEYQFKEKLFEAGFQNIDRCVENRQGELVTYDRYNNPYVMRVFFEGKECNVNNQEEIDLAVDNLAKLHQACREVFQSTEGDVHIRAGSNFRKRNQEIKRVRNFIVRQRPKREFEELYMSVYDYFYGKALECEQNFGPECMDEMREHLGYCHGMYNNHSILLEEKENGSVGVYTINFDKFHVGNQLTDLYHFLRKAVEKNGYSFQMLKNIIERYEMHCPLNEKSKQYIYILFCYPEKFYKISNQYINAPKNWISPKMLDKLNKVMHDEDKKVKLLEQFRNIFLHI